MLLSSAEKSEDGSPVIVIAVDDEASLSYLPKEAINA